MRVIVLIATALLAAGCANEQPAAAEAQEQRRRDTPTRAQVVEAIPSPAGTGAAEPFLFTAREGLLLTWLEPVAGSDRVALRFARYRDGQWSEPRSIVERNDLFVNWADFPSIVEDERGALYAHWLQKSGPRSYDYDVQMAISSDGGGSWGTPFLLNRDGKKAEHGFATLAPLPGGGVGATWLDGRNTAEGGHGGHDAHGGGDMTIRYATVDRNGTILADVELDGRVCECCTTGMTITANGPVIVYRDRSPEEIRDISYVRREGNGWTKPQPLNRDGWKINACPVNGPQIDSMNQRVAAAWFTAADERQRAYVTFSDDAGATFGNPVVIDDGKPAGRVDIVLLDPDTALVTWLEQTPEGAEIRARRVGRTGQVEPSVKIADSSTARAAGFPRIARVGRHVYFTWTEHSKDSKRIHVARREF